MTTQETRPTITAHDLRRQAGQVLADLTGADLPEVAWRIPLVGDFLDLFLSRPRDHHLVDGHATSHQAVRDWAAYLGTDVTLAYGNTPEAIAVINDIIGMRVWCAPEYRDDLGTEKVPMEATAPARCWALQMTTGPNKGLFSDVHGHLPTEEECLVITHERPDLVPVQLDSPCHTVACVMCEGHLGEDDIPGDYHYPRAGEAEEAALANDWWWSGTGWLCPACV